MTSVLSCVPLSRLIKEGFQRSFQMAFGRRLGSGSRPRFFTRRRFRFGVTHWVPGAPFRRVGGFRRRFVRRRFF